MVGHSKLTLDHLPYAPPGPHLPAKTVVLRTFLQNRRKLLPVLVGEALVRAGIGAAEERLFAFLADSTHPLADSPFRHAKGLGNVGLLPPFLFALSV